MAPQNSQNCGRNLRKRKQSDAEFAENSLLRMVIIDRVMNTLLGSVTRHPAGMHRPSRGDAFVSSFVYYALRRIRRPKDPDNPGN